MPRPVARFSIRRGIVAIAAAGLILGGVVAVRDWIRARRGLISATNAYNRTLWFYAEGRVTGVTLTEKSRRVMAARFDLDRSEGARVAATEAHVRRLEWLFERERRELESMLNCRGVGHAELVEMEEALTTARAELALIR